MMRGYYWNNRCAVGKGKVTVRHEEWEVCRGDGKNSCLGLILSSQSYLGNENMLHAESGEISRTKKQQQSSACLCAFEVRDKTMC